jgi:hypothetical protein
MQTTAMKTAAAGIALASLLATDSAAQKLYGYEGSAGTVLEFTTLSAGACPGPTPGVTAWSAMVPAPCGPFAMVGFTPPPGPASLGDIAADSLTDTVYVTDGVVIEQYAEASPVGILPGTAINAFKDPLVGAGTGPITGLGMDDAGLIAGIPLLIMTDGFVIWATAAPPPGSCAPGALVIPPFPSPYPMAAGTMLTDVTFDPSSGTLFLCDSAGMIHNVLPFGGPGIYGFFPAFAIAACGMTPRLEGIAMDLATTPALFSPFPSMYVTDGFTVAYIDAAGAFSPPATYTPMSCSPTPGPLNGLAYVNHSVNYGTPPGGAKIGSMGQPSSPGPTYVISISSPAPAFLWLATGSNAGGPFTGRFCPPLPAVGNPLFVDVFAPLGGVSPIGFVPAGTTYLPSPLPSGLPIGFEVYVQGFLDLTPGAPGGPWLATDALEMVISSP